MPKPGGFMPAAEALSYVLVMLSLRSRYIGLTLAAVFEKMPPMMLRWS